jgi:hypothetical protein
MKLKVENSLSMAKFLLLRKGQLRLGRRTKPFLNTLPKQYSSIDNFNPLLTPLFLFTNRKVLFNVLNKKLKKNKTVLQHAHKNRIEKTLIPKSSKEFQQTFLW